VGSPTSYLSIIAAKNLWAASVGVIDMLHQDQCDNLFHVITGTQRVTLIPSSRYAELYPKIKEGIFNASQVLFHYLGCG
jgi:hypothetical protein